MKCSVAVENETEGILFCRESWCLSLSMLKGNLDLLNSTWGTELCSLTYAHPCSWVVIIWVCLVKIPWELKTELALNCKSILIGTILISAWFSGENTEPRGIEDCLGLIFACHLGKIILLLCALLENMDTYVFLRSVKRRKKKNTHESAWRYSCEIDLISYDGTIK
jgi:hypothetical protein